MKNLLLILLATFMSFNTMVAQDKGYKIGLWGAYNQHPIVEMNKQTTDGYKYVKSSQFIPTGKNSSIDEQTIYGIRLGMSVTQYSDSTYYDLNVLVNTVKDHSLYILKNSPLLIKLRDGEILRLYCNDKEEDNIGYVYSAMYNIVEYSVIANYRIDKKDIEKLQKGISKIRLEINAERVDYEFRMYKHDELGNFLYSAYVIITTALYNQTDFEEGF